MLFVLKKHFEVLTAINLEDARKKIEENSLALALIDYRVGLDDGIRFAAELKMRQPQLPVILISGSLDKPSTIEALRAKVDDVLEKPISQKDLLQVVSKALTPFSKKIRMCAKTRRLYFENEQFELTPTEFRILEILFENSGQSVSKESLQNIAFGYKGCSRNLLDTHIYNLRKKVPFLKTCLQTEVNQIRLQVR